MKKITQPELAEVMKIVRTYGYNMTATPNAGRMQSDFIILLAKKYLDCCPDGPPLYIDHRVNLAAYLEAMELSNDEMPLFVRQSNLHRQDQLIEYRYNKVIKNIGESPVPQIAITARAYWNESDDLPDDFSYEDTLSVPNLKVINERIINYRLLDVENIRIYDQVEGIKGRPTTGVLGAILSIFDAIGWEPSVEQTRGMLSSDSLIILFATSSFGFFSQDVTSTIFPDGHAIEGLPENRSDLEEILKELQKPMEWEYFPYEEYDE